MYLRKNAEAGFSCYPQRPNPASWISYIMNLPIWSTLEQKLFYLTYHITCLVILTGCATSIQPVITLSKIPEPAATQPPATKRPTATAAIFELRPTNTPLASPTLLQIESLPGFGYGPANFPDAINPLTGLTVSDPGLLNRRPMAIKISNFPRAVRPQWGLNSADHIYEYYLEDGLTRFLGIFYGQDANRVGPIRSARLFDIHIVSMYRSIFAFGYGDDQVMDELLATEFKHLLVVQHPDNCPPLCRIDTGDNYNNLFTDTGQLAHYMTQHGDDNQRQNLDGMRFEDSSLLTFGGGVAEQIVVRYSDFSFHLWEYNASTRRYNRSQEADTRLPGQEIYQPLMDSLTGEQVTADNLVILFVNTTFYYKSSSTEIYNINLLGQGAGYALRDGKVFKITWKRTTSDAILTLELSGAPFPFKPGNVWFIVLGETSAERMVDNTTWEFTYSMP